MNPELFEELVKWQKQGERGVTIKLGAPYAKEAVDIFCYDYIAMNGRHITTIADVIGLDFQKEKEEKEKAELERLKLKFQNLDINEGGI